MIETTKPAAEMIVAMISYTVISTTSILFFYFGMESNQDNYAEALNLIIHYKVTPSQLLIVNFFFSLGLIVARI